MAYKISLGACPEQNNKIPHFVRNDKRGGRNDIAGVFQSSHILVKPIRVKYLKI